ncbi:hypothetical protein MGG_13037 [Pyricularia oryzae 70-15]|uniref:Uncharacterized protein n=1 Tax=Pyricularia oryzae (strain 70-15 / ATCC MYA-4617 / FGSC 8958) TaxID=242507 RepID=G4ML97_PYRO7|nr:uncharacterized protein MGG_13037 [Pyricularia oryzae 70-15]EHA57627.1 hypothetical protein MGG_13037 [Pyricularia oryzae 70-15]KAI7925599.1 hypothetical protein M9X92_003160 [Pyricularia oryzae]
MAKLIMREAPEKTTVHMANTKGLEDDACSKCLGSVHILHSPECPKDPNAGQIEPHESAVPEGVVEFEDLAAEVDSETEHERMQRWGCRYAWRE